MAIKQAATDFREDRLGDLFHQHFNTVFLRFTVRDDILEHIREVVQRETVHRVDLDQLLNHEEGGHPSAGHRLILDHPLGQFFLLLFRDDDLLWDCPGDFFWDFQTLNQFDIIQDHPAGIGQQIQDTFLAFLQQEAIIRDTGDQFTSDFVFFRHFKAQDIPQKFLLQTLFRDWEVNNLGFDVDFGEVVGIVDFGDEVESESCIEFDFGFIDLHIFLAFWFHVAFFEDIVQEGREAFLDILDQDGSSQLNLIFNGLLEVVLGGFCHGVVVFILHLLQPFHGLVLWVNNKRVFEAVMH